MNVPTQYRQDIDGLRAVAVLLVVLFHFFPALLPGGFIGVDMFFPISGFLISAIITKEIQKDEFFFANFYDRRIRRIFPSLITVLSLSFLVGWVFLAQRDYLSLTKNVAAGAAFIANFISWKDTGYFNTSSEFKPLLHLWSLGVEEQFYIFWPLILALSWRYLKSIGFTMVIILIFSFVWNVATIKSYPTSTFYLLPSRLWELAIGGMASQFYSLEVNKLKSFLQHKYFPVFKDLCSLLGGSGIWLGLRFIDQSEPFPGWWALLPVVGTTLLILSGPTALLNRSILSRPWLMFVGVISYPLYLWHWPLLAFTRIIGLGEPSRFAKIAIIALSFLFAWLTYRFVEKPLRRTVVETTSYLLLAMGGICFISFSAAMGWLPSTRFQKLSKYYEFGFDPSRSDIYLSSKYIKLFRQECEFSYIEEHSLKLDPTCIVPIKKRSVFLWGDSHTQHLNAGLTKYFSKDDVSILQIATSNCPARIPLKNNTYCDHSNEAALRAITELRPDVVVLSEQGALMDVKKLKTVIQVLRNVGVKNILLVGPNPDWWPELYKIVVRKYVYFGQPVPQKVAVGLTRPSFEVDRVLKREFGDSDNVKYASVIDQLCSADGCLARVGDNLPEDLLLIDGGHFSEKASVFVADKLLGPIIRKMLEQNSKSRPMNGVFK